jgi:hypothetical protein
MLRRQAAMQCAEACRQNISRERVRLAEMQYNLEILRQQGRKAPLHNQIPNKPPLPSPPHNHILHHPNQPPQTHPLQPPLPPHMGTIDPKSPLAEHLQLAPWPLHYRAVTPPKYHGNKEPRKFLMCYEATIASAGGDDATLAKSLIISLEDAAENWYSKLPPYTPKPLYCMYHGNKTDHRTKDYSIYIDTKRKMNQDTTQPSPELHSREVNHTTQWAPRNQQHSSLYPSHYPAQTYQNS